MKKNGKEQSYNVVKNNDLIQKAKFDLTAIEQKLINYVISKIRPTDKEFQNYFIPVADFCELCGIRKDRAYTEFRTIIERLDQKSVWIENSQESYKLRWFSEAKLIKGKGMIKVLLHSELHDYLIGLGSNFTKYEIYNILALKSKYSIRLYEIFKSYEYQSGREFEIESLKEKLFAVHYKNFHIFSERVLTPAVTEINKYTDIDVSYDLYRRGRGGKVVSITFFIKPKATINKYLAYRKTLEKLNNTGNQVHGQMSFDDYDYLPGAEESE